MTIAIDFTKERQNTFDDDYMTMQLVPDANVRALELGLFTAKWFDYRHLTPLKATIHYIDCYAKVYRQKYEEHFDAITAEVIATDTFEKLLLALDDPKKATKTRGKISSYWRGRQFADAIGIPYDLYIDLAMDFRLRYWKQRYLPKPGHLYGDMVLEKVQSRWHEIQTGRLYLAENPLFRATSYQGLPDQDSYHEWIFYQSTLRNEPERFLARMIKQNELPKEKAEARLMPSDFQILEQYLSHYP